MSKSIFLSKETIRRLLLDIKNISINPLTDNGIYYIHDDEDLLKGYALIIGPDDTPYFGGFYFFEFQFPTDYPHSPPIVLYRTNHDNIRFNPNLYTNGKVCISLLNTWKGEQWTSCQTLSTILLNLCTVLCKDSLLNEPGVSTNHQDFINYNNVIEYKNIDIAIIKMMRKQEGVFLPHFEAFYPIMKEQFLKNKDKIISFLEQKCIDYPNPTKNIIHIYSMAVLIDYPRLQSQFIKYCNNI
jgi:ubiquitin-protein ligase